LSGPDHAASLEPTGLQKLVRDIRQIEMAMGSPEKDLAPAEVPVRARLGKSVVAARHIPAGAVISAEMLAAKSPGDGIPANQLERLVGRVAEIDVPCDKLLPSEALGWELRAPAQAREAH
ncbi:MAG: N-acetylneuraminate synthase family protein, partial [Chloroflexi bacterium]|nr:N-acetylneuraminate synthase family protein [Chloroflexota bacterium]